VRTHSLALIFLRVSSRLWVPARDPTKSFIWRQYASGIWGHVSLWTLPGTHLGNHGSGFGGQNPQLEDLDRGTPAM